MPNHAPNLAMIGLTAEELAWTRLLVKQLRDPDPVVGELAREALLFVERQAAGGAREPCGVASVRTPA